MLVRKFIAQKHLYFFKVLLECWIQVSSYPCISINFNMNLFFKKRTISLVLLILAVCFTVQGQFPQEKLLIQSDRQNQTLNKNQNVRVVDLDRHTEFPFTGVMGIWNKNIRKEDESVIVEEKFKMPCEGNLTLYVMVDNEFRAYINNVQVMRGATWDKLFRKEINYQKEKDKYKLNFCGENVLKVRGKNHIRQASIAYQLVYDADCQDCGPVLEFNRQTCRCDNHPLFNRLQYDSSSALLLDRPLNWTGNLEVNLPIRVPQNATEILIQASIAIQNFPTNGKLRLNVMENDGQGQKLVYPIIVYGYGSGNFVDVHESFSIPVPKDNKIILELNNAFSNSSRIVLEPTGFAID